MLDTAQRVTVYAAMAGYVLFWIVIAIPERHTTSLVRWVVAAVRRAVARDDDTD